MKKIFYLITLYIFILSINSCYVEDEFVLNSTKSFYWVESEIEIGQKPMIYITSFIKNKRAFPKNAIVTIYNKTNNKQYSMPYVSKFQRYKNDSLFTELDQQYILKVVLDDAVFIDSLYTYNHDFQYKLKIEQYSQDESLLIGRITGNNPNNLVVFNPIHGVSPITVENLDEIRLNVDYRLNYICGKRRRNDMYQKSLQYTDFETYKKLTRFVANVNQFEAKSSLLSPINYDNNILENKITGFFGYFGRINSSVLEDLDDSKIIKTIKITRESDNVDITNQLDTFELLLVTKGKNGVGFSPQRSYNLGSYFSVTQNEINNLKYEIDYEDSYCQLFNLLYYDQGVYIKITLNNVNYNGFTVFSDPNLEEILTIKVKPF